MRSRKNNLPNRHLPPKHHFVDKSSLAQTSFLPADMFQHTLGKLIQTARKKKPGRGNFSNFAYNEITLSFSFIDNIHSKVATSWKRCCVWKSWPPTAITCGFFPPGQMLKKPVPHPPPLESSASAVCQVSFPVESVIFAPL